MNVNPSVAGPLARHRFGHVAWQLASVLLWLALAGGCRPRQQTAEVSRPAAPPPVDFNRQIRPLLSDRCFVCHGPDIGNMKAGMQLHRFELATKPLREGVTPMVPGDREASQVWHRINDPKSPMPPPQSHKSLSRQEIELLGRWIDEGAHYDIHWAYTLPAAHEPPAVRRRDWVLDPIDRFILARQEEADLSPSPDADRATLLRRLSLDLIGLPPTPEELDTFLADATPGAYETRVDRLLADPRFGENLAGWWLDLVRYADSVGYHGDQARPMWPYRDWVVEAFNSNMPFDRFSTWQLAGDLFPEPTHEQIIAAAYNRLASETAEGGAQDGEYIAIYADDRVRNLGEVWLASSTGCARCHDHKYDPILTRDFYSLAAYFADIDTPAVNNNGGKVEATWLPWIFVPTDEKQAQRVAALEKEYQTLLAVHGAAAKDLELALVSRNRSVPALKGDWVNRFRELHKQRLALAKEIPWMAITRPRAEPRETRVLPRGNWLDRSGEVRLPAIPAFLGGEMDPEAPRQDRRDLAKWLFSPENPLTARAMANRLWARFFGHGISPDLIDFGGQGQPPSHPYLLDHLALSFEDGWDVKALIRRLVTCHTYRQSAALRTDVRRRDPGNRLWARQETWRLAGEKLRDQALAVSGLLNPARGGPSVFPYQPKGHWEPLNFPRRNYVISEGAALYRRSLYSWVQRTFPNPVMTNFDVPSRETCVAMRARTNTPLQALTTLNSPIFVEAARQWAAALAALQETDDARLAYAGRQILSRVPNPAETAVLRDLLENQRKQFAADEAAAGRLAAAGESPVSTAVPAVEVAAWTQVCRVFLNLNESLTRP